jgi:hypothetical protein
MTTVWKNYKREKEKLYTFYKRISRLRNRDRKGDRGLLIRILSTKYLKISGSIRANEDKANSSSSSKSWIFLAALLLSRSASHFNGL